MTTLINPSTEQLKEQVDLILHSPVFAGSETLRKLLAFLAAHTMEGHAESLKVREIAVAVFGRTQDFDSQSDSVVRVHTGRLRSKLAEYYVGDGADDEVIVSIPKGGYALTCHFRHPGSTRLADLPATGEPSAPELAPMGPSLSSRTPTAVVITPKLFALSLMLVAALVWAATAYIHSRMQRAGTPQSLQTFWQDFTKPGAKAVIVFSNFRLLASGAGLTTYVGPDDPGKQIIDTYTTMGEVMGVFNVSRTLLQMGKAAEAKRSRLLTWDGAKDSNLIFVGGPLAETPLRDVTLLREFQFNQASLRGRDVGAIYNNRPRSGESPIYFASDSIYSVAGVRTSKVDYAIVALRPSFNPSHRVMILAGISEYGTQGAADFVVNESAVANLLSRLGVKRGGAMPLFEALVKVQVEGGVPVESELVAVHALK